MVKKNHSFNKVYIVEDILDTKLINGCQFYKVKWKDYSHAECTWEPQESFNCSRDILNQFLQARAKKEPSFNQKLRKIQKQKKPFDKIDSKILDKNKPIKKPEKKEKQEQDSDAQNDMQMLLEKDQQNDQFGSEESEENDKELTNKSSKGKSFKSDQIKVQERKSNNSPCKTLNPPKQPTKPQQNAHTIYTVKAKAPSISKPTLTPSTLPKKMIGPLEILSVSKKDGQLKFFVKENNHKIWKTKDEMHQKYLKELCDYYESHLCFEP